MVCVPSIAAALRSCMPCDAAPPTRHWFQADQISSDRASPGRKVDVRLNSVPARDSLGRIAHVRGLYFFANGTFTVGQNFVGPVPARQLRGLFSAIVMQDVTGHQYFPSIDARDLGDDVFFRHWARIGSPVLFTGHQSPAGAPIAPPYLGAPFWPTQDQDFGFAAGTAPGTYTVPLSFYFPFPTLGPGMNPLASLIPLAALQRASNQGSLRFTLLSAVPGAPADLSFDSVEDENGEAGMSVWLDVVYLPALAIDPAWTLDRYTLPELRSGLLRAPEATTEHAWIRGHEEDTFTPKDLDGITLNIAGFGEMSALTQLEAQVRALLFAAERDSAQTRMNAAQDLPFRDPATGDPTSVLLIPYRQRGTGPASGPIDYKIASVGNTNTFLPFVHRYVSCNEGDRADAFAKAVECDPCARSVMTDGKGNPVGSGATTQATMLVLDPKANGR